MMFVYRLLDLDMVVRDDQGNILNPDITSTIQLYWQHELATERIRKATVSFKIFSMTF
jgi:dedicator of cytokinesis protein 1